MNFIVATLIGVPRLQLEFESWLEWAWRCVNGHFGGFHRHRRSSVVRNCRCFPMMSRWSSIAHSHFCSGTRLSPPGCARQAHVALRKDLYRPNFPKLGAACPKIWKMQDVKEINFLEDR